MRTKQKRHFTDEAIERMANAVTIDGVIQYCRANNYNEDIRYIEKKYNRG